LAEIASLNASTWSTTASANTTGTSKEGT
jgi:hypothetical protein